MFLTTETHQYVEDTCREKETTKYLNPEAVAQIS